MNADRAQYVRSSSGLITIVVVVMILHLLTMADADIFYLKKRRLIRFRRLPSISQEVIGGFQVRAEYPNQLVHVFQRIVFSIIHRFHQQKYSMSVNGGPEVECTVENWSTGSRVSCGQMTTIVLLGSDGNHATVVSTGPIESRKQLFFLQVG